MAPKKDVRSRFSAKENESKRSRISIPKITTIATDNASQAEVDMAKEEVNKESAKRQKYQNVPEKDRTKAAVDNYSKSYSKYDLKHTSLST